MPYLLDVNVLVALFDEAHIHHSAAHDWFARTGNEGWRTCPITENGLLRILSHPAYPNFTVPMTDLAERLEQFKAACCTSYSFWSADYSLSALLASAHLPLASAQSTDAYLLALCHQKQGALATFDQRIRPTLIGETSGKIVEHIPF